jgi:methylmalonyl-CoA/ethylmalonyl-CoA epimerase
VTVRFDHIALAVLHLADVTPFLVGELGGEPAYGARARFFSFYQWRYEGGGRLEILEPSGADGFLHRFLAAHGPGVHHVTFRVPDLADTCARAERHGYKIVGYDDSDPHWKEAFLHPKQALGIVVQLAQMSRRTDGKPPVLSTPPAAPPNPPAPVTMLGLRLSARSRERAELQWGELLSGSPSRGERGQLVYHWERSALAITVEIDSDADEGPLAIEFASTRAVDVPAGAHPILGAPFVRRVP